MLPSSAAAHDGISSPPDSFRRSGTWRVVCPTERLFDHRNRFGLAQTQLAQVTLTLTKWENGAVCVADDLGDDPVARDIGIDNQMTPNGCISGPFLSRTA